MKMNRLNTTALALVIAAFSFMPACGQATDSSVKVGKAGPTTPSGYYFEMVVSPAVVKTGGSLTATVNVTNAAGAAITAGPTCYFSGDVSSGSATADTTTGICAASISVSGSAGSTGYVAVTVENKSLSAAFQVKP